MVPWQKIILKIDFQILHGWPMVLFGKFLNFIDYAL